MEKNLKKLLSIIVLISLLFTSGLCNFVYADVPTVSGTISRPSGTASSTAITGKVFMSGLDYSSVDFTIPAGYNSTTYTLPLSSIGTYGLEFRVYTDDVIVGSSYYKSSGLTTAYSDRELLNSADGTKTGINATLLKAYCISGTISLPNGAAAPSDGVRINLYGKSDGPDEKWYGTSYMQIPSGQKSAQYKLSVREDASDFYIMIDVQNHTDLYSDSDYKASSFVSGHGSYTGINLTVGAVQGDPGTIPPPQLSVDGNVLVAGGLQQGLLLMVFNESGAKIYEKSNINTEERVEGLPSGKYRAKQRNTTSSTESNLSNQITLDSSAGGSVSEVSINKATTTIPVGQFEQLTATVTPSSVTDKSVAWSVYSQSGSNVVTVSGIGVVTAMNPGSAVIRATSNADNSKYDECNVISIIPVTGVAISKSDTTIEVGKTQQLTATISPNNASNQTVLWSVHSQSGSNVVSVSTNGLVTGINLGTAVIRVTSGQNSSFYADCNVTITPAGIGVTGVTLDKNTALLSIGGSEQLTANVQPGNATNTSIIWTSNNQLVATVSNGAIQAVSGGTATIRATSESNPDKYAECVVTVKIPVSSVSLNKNSTNLFIGRTEQLTADITPNNPYDGSIIWTSSNTTVASVSNGLVTAIAAGSAVIRVASVSNPDKYASCLVIVAVPVNNITLNKNNTSIYVGDSELLTANVFPAHASNKDINWTSGNTSVATVSGGTVTAVGTGTAAIRAVSVSNPDKYAECVVTVSVKSSTSSSSSSGTSTSPAPAPIIPEVPKVTESAFEVENVTLNQHNLVIYEGESKNLSVSVYPDNAKDKTVIWESSDTNIVRVSDGEITAVKAGNANIKVSSKPKSELYDVCSVAVAAKGELSGIISLPEGKAAPEGGLKAKIIVFNGGTGSGYIEHTTQVTIPEGENSVSYVISLQGDPAGTQYFVKAECVTKENSGIYYTEYYTKSGSSKNSYDAFKDGGVFGPTIKNINITLGERPVIKATISLPKGETAPRGGITMNLVVANNQSQYASGFPLIILNKFPVKIEEGQNQTTVEHYIADCDVLGYRIYVDGNPQGYSDRKKYDGVFSPYKEVSISDTEKNNEIPLDVELTRVAVRINGETCNLNISPEVSEYEYYVPLRPFLEKTGWKEITWHSEDSSVTASKNDLKIKFKAGGNTTLSGRVHMGWGDFTLNNYTFYIKSSISGGVMMLQMKDGLGNYYSSDGYYGYGLPEPIYYSSAFDRQNLCINIETNDIKVSVNGNIIDCEKPARMANNTAYASVRSVAEALEADSITWDKKTNSVIIKKDTRIIRITPDSEYIEIDGERSYYWPKAFVEEGKLMIPIRVLAERGFGAKVEWDAKFKTVNVTTKAPKMKKRIGFEYEQQVIDGNTPPVINSVKISKDGPYKSGETVTLTVSASDRDGDDLFCFWQANAVSLTETNDKTYNSVKWTAPDKPGKYLLRVYIGDGCGGLTKKTIVMEVK